MNSTSAINNKTNGFYTQINSQKPTTTLFPSSYDSQPFDFLTSIKDHFSNPGERTLEMRRLAAEISEVEISDEVINQISQTFHSEEYSSSYPALSKIFNALSSDTLNILLHKIFSDAIDHDPVKTVEKIKGILTLQKIELAISKEFKGFKGALNEAGQTSGISIDAIKKKEDEEKNTIFQTIKVTVESLIEYVLDTLLKAFQIDSIGEEIEDDSQASMRFMMFTSLSGTLIGALAALEGILGGIAITAIVIVSTILLLGTALVAYYNWLKPCPKECAPFINFTTEAKKGPIDQAVGRDGEMKELMNSLVANSSKAGVRRHPLLVADSGAGKTTLIKSLAAKIARGDDDVPAELRGKEVFYINIAKICGESSSVKRGNAKMDVLSKVQKKMSRYKKDCIFIFDEVQSAFKDPNNQLVAENLKTFFDPGPGGFPYCAALTTRGEYEQYVASNVPFVRRTKLIPIDMMDQDSTRLLLRHTALQDAPELNYEDVEIEDETISIFEAIYYALAGDEILKNKPQPLTALTVLTDAITKVRSRKKSKIDEDLIKVQQEIQELEMTYNLKKDKRTADPENETLLKVHAAKKAAREKLENEVAKNEEKYKSYFEWLRKYRDLEEKVTQKAINIGQRGDDNTRTSLLQDFILDRYFVSPAMREKINTTEAEFHEKFPNARTKVDIELITEVINELKKMDELKASRNLR